MASIARKQKPHKAPYTGVIPDGMRYCPECETTKDVALFTSKTGRYYVYCQKCRNERQRKRYTTEHGVYIHLLRAYHLTKTEYETMLIQQSGVCACCGKPETRLNFHSKEVQRLSVDHDHSTNTVRSLLCSACNEMIGNIETSPGRLVMVLRYLEKHNPQLQEHINASEA